MNVTIGFLAHVDAGKTTLSEQALCHAGVLRAAGRVDHGDAFLDAHPLERQRGITIFSDQATFERGGRRFFWVDTPGHADFSAEMERTLPVLDCAVLVISGTDGVQSHMRTLLRLLERYRVPAFIFVNKMDLPCPETGALLERLNTVLPGCVAFSDPDRDDAEVVYGLEDILKSKAEKEETSIGFDFYATTIELNQNLEIVRIHQDFDVAQ